MGNEVNFWKEQKKCYAPYTHDAILENSSVSFIKNYENIKNGERHFHGYKLLLLKNNLSRETNFVVATDYSKHKYQSLIIRCS